MYQFLNAAMPWILLGIFVAIVTAGLSKSKKDRRQQENCDNTRQDHGLRGMCVGMLFGIALSTSCNIPLWIGQLFGLGIGYLMGCIYKKKDKQLTDKSVDK